MHSTVRVACNILENSTALPQSDRNIRSEYPFSVQQNKTGHQGLSRENNTIQIDFLSSSLSQQMQGKTGNLSWLERKSK